MHLRPSQVSGFPLGVRTVRRNLSRELTPSSAFRTLSARRRAEFLPARSAELAADRRTLIVSSQERIRRCRICTDGNQTGVRVINRRGGAA